MNKVLWAPWRMEFILKAHQQKPGCIFCSLPKEGINSKTLVLYQGKNAFVILNRYPYTNGHLMVVPSRHLNRFEKLTASEHQEIGFLISQSMEALKKTSRPHGFNVGLNLGRAAGAGIKGHLHYHVIPRWVGDNNFMPVMSEVRMMPEHLLLTYQKLKKHFKSS